MPLGQQQTQWRNVSFAKRHVRDDFHTFAIEWTEGKITWLIDGKPYQTQTKWNTDAAEFPAPFNERFHLVLNVAIGGGFVGNPNGSATFPQSMLVDYVRVYQ